MSELGDEARALIEATQDGDDPSSIDRARVRARLFGAAAGLGIATSAAQAKAAAGSAGLSGSALGAGSSVKLALAGAALVAGVSASVAYVSRAPAPPPRAPAVQTQPAVRAALPVPAAVPAELDAPPQVAAIEPVQTQESARERAKPSDRARTRRAARGAAQPTVLPALSERASQGSSLALELSLLGTAQQALAAGDFERALAILRRHAARFPRGVLVPERMAAQAIAHCGAGQAAQGRQQLSALAREAPSSPLLSRASARCE